MSIWKQAPSIRPTNTRWMRLKRQYPQPKPMMTGSNIVYDMDGRHQGTAYGGIGNIHQLAARNGLIDEIDSRIQLLQRHLPYYESDHILNIAYNYLVGGSCLQDIEQLKNGVKALYC